jgi:cytochrome c oxidase subunit 3
MAMASQLPPNSAPSERQQYAGKPIVDPKIFVTWLFIVSSCMIFAGFTSAYILASKDAAWREFNLPTAFTISTVLIVLSSVTMHWAFLSAKRNRLNQVKIAVIATLVLGTAFLFMQLQGYAQMVEMGFVLVSVNKNGAFWYVISGAHGLHIVAGLILLIAVLISSLRMKIHSKAMRQITSAATFWHFLDILWLYLFVFFSIQ